jgi:hypothetical protein
MQLIELRLRREQPLARFLPVATRWIWQAGADRFDTPWQQPIGLVPCAFQLPYREGIQNQLQLVKQNKSIHTIALILMTMLHSYTIET